MSGVPARMWLRWSLRDLRRRWQVVAATALVLAIGTGLSAGLSSALPWRLKSADASFAALHAHDLRVSLPEGARAKTRSLHDAVRAALGADAVTVQERLTAPTQIDASRPGHTVLVPGRVIGVDPGAGRRLIDGLWVERGRGLTARDDGRAVGLLEASFAKHHELPAQMSLRLPGGARMRAVGHARSPEWFIVAQQGAGWGGESSYAVLFVPLATAQRLAGAPGAVNEAVVRLRAGVDRRSAQRRLTGGLLAAGVGAQVTRLDQESAHRLLYRDARNDQKTYTVFALLLLGGAAIAAFNLISRVVDSQRREIGIGMALGVEPRALALRPLLLGAEIAVLGVVLGIGAGTAATAALRPALQELLPLPVVDTPFQPWLFARAAAVGFLIPFAAATLPVWRAVRVTPVEAIRTGFRSARGSGLAPLLRRVRLPGGSLGQLPARNVLRAPRRTILTVIGMGAVVGTIVAIGGMLDSFTATIDRAQAEEGRGARNRLVVELDRLHRRDDSTLRAVARTDGIARLEPLVRTDAEVRGPGGAVDVALTLVAGSSRVWRPSTQEGRLAPGSSGVLLSERAAEQLGVRAGDTITLRHPQRTGATTFALRDARVPVAGIHRDPFRHVAFADAGWARRMGLAGTANLVQLIPAANASEDAIKRSLLDVPGVASVQRATAIGDAFDKAMSAFSGVLRVGWYAALLLGLLMAFNVASVAADERSREHATMFAFGLPVRTVVVLSVVEYAVVGILATLMGLAIGRVIVGWMVGSLLPDSFPELGMLIHLEPISVAAAATAGLVVMAVAPLFTMRRLRTMDVPSTLRVVE